ncbi:DUF6326 family protein [Pedococcus sp. NPDC057267]|uniref:DUF6326 family protein n=1 Tax=Pedococcus sp. NPDC057267 TaxID=3346077 RepID=UPI0036402C86
MTTTTHYLDHRVDPRLTIAASWTSMLFLFVCVDLFSLYRKDVRADLEAGTVAAFTVGQGYLLGVIVYVAVPSLMLLLSLVMPARVTRAVNMAVAGIYAVTIAASAVGEWAYFVVGSVLEFALLVAIAYQAWTWPKVTGPLMTSRGEEGRQAGRREPGRRGGRARDDTGEVT